MEDAQNVCILSAYGLRFLVGFDFRGRAWLALYT